VGLSKNAELISIQFRILRSSKIRRLKIELFEMFNYLISSFHNILNLSNLSQKLNFQINLLFASLLVPCQTNKTISPQFTKEQSDQTIEKNRPILWNESKTVAKISKLKLKVQKSSIKVLLNVTTKTCFETYY